MKDVGGAGFAGSSPSLLGRERAAVNVDVGPERRSPRYHETFGGKCESNNGSADGGKDGKMRLVLPRTFSWQRGQRARVAWSVTSALGGGVNGPPGMLRYALVAAVQGTVGQLQGVGPCLCLAGSLAFVVTSLWTGKHACSTWPYVTRDEQNHAAMRPFGSHFRARCLRRRWAASGDAARSRVELGHERAGGDRMVCSSTSTLALGEHQSRWSPSLRYLLPQPAGRNGDSGPGAGPWHAVCKLHPIAAAAGCAGIWRKHPSLERARGHCLPVASTCLVSWVLVAGACTARGGAPSVCPGYLCRSLRIN